MRNTEKSEIVRIDISQPGAADLIKIIGSYDPEAIAFLKDGKGKTCYAVKLVRKPKNTRKKTRKVRGFHLGDIIKDHGSSAIRQSCAVTVK